MLLAIWLLAGTCCVERGGTRCLVWVWGLTHTKPCDCDETIERRFECIANRTAEQYTSSKIGIILSPTTIPPFNKNIYLYFCDKPGWPTTPNIQIQYNQNLPNQYLALAHNDGDLALSQHILFGVFDLTIIISTLSIYICTLRIGRIARSLWLSMVLSNMLLCSHRDHITNSCRLNLFGVSKYWNVFCMCRWMCEQIYIKRKGRMISLDFILQSAFGLYVLRQFQGIV